MTQHYKPASKERIEAFTVAYRTARTRPERRAAIDAFLNRPAPLEGEERFNKFLARPGHEIRAAATSPDTAGGSLIPVGWYKALLHLAREYGGISAGFDTFETVHGQETVQPAFSAFASLSDYPGENQQITDGPYNVISQREWPEAKIYAGSVTASRNLAHDYAADGTLATFVKRGLAENLGRNLATDAASTVYGAVGSSSTTVSLTAAKALALDSGASTELAANGLTIATYAAMWKALDAGYKPSAEWRMNSTQAETLSRTVDPQGRYVLDPSTGIAKLFNRPVRVTNSISDLTASTASGPVLMSPRAAFTQRVVTGDAMFLASEEARAEYGQMYYRLVFRSSFMAADPAACVGVVPAAT